MAKYGVLLIGGNRTHQEGYGRAFAEDPRCEVVAVADERDIPDYRAGLHRLLASELGVPYIDDLDRALARDDVDIVSTCADVERRGRVGVKCARAGKHVYLDKPLAGSVEDARAIADAVEKAGVRSQMFTQIAWPWAQAAKAAVQRGAVGRLLAINADMLMAKGRPGTVPAGLVRKERGTVDRFTFVEAKRELFDMGVYSVSLVHWLSGQRVKTVYGTTGNYFFQEHASHGIEDFCALVMTLEDGTLATATGGRFGWTTHPRGGVMRAVLIGTEGYMVFSEAEPHIEVFNDDAPFTLPVTHPFDPMAMWSSTTRDTQPRPKTQWVSLHDSSQTIDITRFVDCIEEGRESDINARTAVHHVEVIMAGYASAAAGEPVVLS